jgi:hypothetical protein
MKTSRVVLSGLCLVAIVLFSGAAWAQNVVTVHGHSGHIQDENITSYPIYWGWGLDFEQNPGTINWIHYSLPVPYGARTRYLAFRFETLSADAFISEIYVINGNGPAIYWEGDLSLSGGGGPQWYIVDMQVDKVIDQGLGISIGIVAGVEMMSHRFLFYAVAAEWH